MKVHNISWLTEVKWDYYANVSVASLLLTPVMYDRDDSGNMVTWVYLTLVLSEPLPKEFIHLLHGADEIARRAGAWTECRIQGNSVARNSMHQSQSPPNYETKITRRPLDCIPLPDFIGDGLSRLSGRRIKAGHRDNELDITVLAEGELQHFDNFLRSIVRQLRE